MGVGEWVGFGYSELFWVGLRMGMRMGMGMRVGMGDEGWG